jgi:hypothetical protein
MRKITIHKPTHKWFIAGNPIAICIGQLRGSTLYLNRIGTNGQVIEKRVARAASWDLTGYGKGVAMGDLNAIARMQGAWHYMFGDIPAPNFCERHGGETYN